MIARIELKHFKCFEQLNLPIAPLTLLSGQNGSGKSSVIQALVLLHQTMHDHEWSNRLMLNGTAVKLGTVADIVDKVHGRRNIAIGITEGDVNYRWEFSGERSEMSMAIENVAINDNSKNRPGMSRYLLPYQRKEEPPQMALRMKELTYITAERVGPREVYSIEDRQTSTVVGPAGEHTVGLLQLGRDEHVLPGLVLDGTPPTRLRQVEARMRLFFPGFSLQVQQVPQANAVTLGIRTSDDTDFHRPIHVGFGLTQVLPIIVAVLSATQDNIILIENPEVHLHPAGQALMGQFLADSANAGTQVIVETHSDHVLNGIRWSIKANRLKPELVAIHFFKPRSAESPHVISPEFTASGNIDNWPDGFFDQFDKDMNYFAGWGK